MMKTLAMGAFSSPRKEIVDVSVFTPTEKLLKGLFDEILQVQVESVDDDFFDMGGHSFLAAKLLSQLRKTHNVDGITMRDIYAAKTVKDIAKRIDVLRDSKTVYDRQASSKLIDMAAPNAEHSIIMIEGDYAPVKKKPLPVFLPHVISLVSLYLLVRVFVYLI